MVMVETVWGVLVVAVVSDVREKKVCCAGENGSSGGASMLLPPAPVLRRGGDEKAEGRPGLGSCCCNRAADESNSVMYVICL